MQNPSNKNGFQHSFPVGAIFFLTCIRSIAVPRDKDRVTAAFSLTCHSFLHCGELTLSIKWQDIKIDMVRQCLDAWLQWSQINPSGKGTTITLAASTNLSICRVRKLTEYKQISVFVYHNEGPLTRAALTTDLRKSSHSVALPIQMTMTTPAIPSSLEQQHVQLCLECQNTRSSTWYAGTVMLSWTTTWV